jgi:membrane-bound serine protease (ClpP class)
MPTRFIATILLSLAAALILAGPVAAEGAPVYLVEINGAIAPGNSDFLNVAIDRANTEGAGCLIVVLDTPGGLAESMRTMVMAIYASRIPVVVYVSPSG